MDDQRTITVTATIVLTGEPGAEGTEQPGITAEQKEAAVRQLVKDQMASIRTMYDQPYEPQVTGTISSAGNANTENI